MIVAIGGMPRSGSTFSFNIVRESLAMRENVAVAAEDNFLAALAVSGSARHLIIKSHTPDSLCTKLILKEAIPCICTIRKPEDAIASWMRFFGHGLEDTVASMASWLTWHTSVSKHVLNICYELIDQEPLNAVLAIQKYIIGQTSIPEAALLARRYDKKQLKNELDLMSIGENTENLEFGYYDKLTLFHKSHISSLDSVAAVQELTEQQIRFIRNKLRSFVDEQGVYFWEGLL